MIGESIEKLLIMFGAVCGDTVGSIYEFNETKDYGFVLFGKDSNFTDDSIMSVAVAAWLLKDESHSYEALEKEMVRLAKGFPCPMGGYGGSFGDWLFRPERLMNESDEIPHLYQSPEGRYPYGSWGNGSAMRASACGWFFDTLEETERVAGISASITHNHPEGIKGAQAVAAAIWMARNGRSKDEIRDFISSGYGYDLDRSCEYLNRTYRWDSSCQGTVPEAIIAFLESVDFEDALRKAVSMGGDSDTLACITGGIAEAYYREIPEKIRSVVWSKLPMEFRETIRAVAERTPYGDVFKGYGL